jgi:diguanylate cyclase (GGDEF)-like protein
MMLDIDQFKQINDIYGHLTGDRVLVGVTQRCAQELRQIDLLGRYGGDEFVALLPETGIENACRVAERLRTTIAAIPFNANGKPLHITISVGVACMQDGRKTLEELVECADGALYQAKENGRNRIEAV